MLQRVYGTAWETPEQVSRVLPAGCASLTHACAARLPQAHGRRGSPPRPSQAGAGEAHRPSRCTSEPGRLGGVRGTVAPRCRRRQATARQTAWARGGGWGCGGVSERAALAEALLAQHARVSVRCAGHAYLAPVNKQCARHGMVRCRIRVCDLVRVAAGRGAGAGPLLDSGGRRRRPRLLAPQGLHTHPPPARPARPPRVRGAGMRLRRLCGSATAVAGPAHPGPLR